MVHTFVSMERPLGEGILRAKGTGTGRLKVLCPAQTVVRHTKLSCIQRLIVHTASLVNLFTCLFLEKTSQDPVGWLKETRDLLNCNPGFPSDSAALSSVFKDPYFQAEVQKLSRYPAFLSTCRSRLTAPLFLFFLFLSSIVAF